MEVYERFGSLNDIFINKNLSEEAKYDIKSLT